MSLLTTSAASIHQLFAAAALAGPPSSPANETLSSNGDGQTIKSLWSRYEIVADVLLSAGWLIEQHTLRTTHDLDPETNKRVAIKDICVVGVMATNIANIAIDQMFKRAAPEGLRLTSAGDVPDDSSADARQLCQYSKTMKIVNRIFVAGAIGFTPLVNFSVLKSYRPSTLYRLFT
jgi:hypothetical protein